MNVAHSVLGAVLNDPKFRTDFFATCRRGLSAVRPFAGRHTVADPLNWNYGACKLPSYSAYGRARALLTLEVARRLTPNRVLEVAAGDAALVACLESQLGCEVAANDLRGENLAESVQCFSNADRIRLVPGNILEIAPEQTGLFDLVIACEVIEHVAHSVRFLEHLKRFLAPGGRLLITTPNGKYFHNHLPTYSHVRDFDALEHRQFQPDADGHLFLITPEELRQISKQSGLSPIWIDVVATPFITGHCGFRLLGSSKAVPWYRIESMMQRLPDALRHRVSFLLFALLEEL